jgi:energy-converting hydrogenase Eha subunit F
MRVRYAIALLVAAALLAPASMSLQAQTPAPLLKKSAPPLRGTAELGFIQTAKLDGNNIVTIFQVKNLSATNAIVGLQISEFWYDKAGTPLQGTGDRQRLRSPLQPLDVATITLTSPKVPGMTTPQYKFEQNNGAVKPVSMKQVKQLKPGPNT